jgi:hypothetical protein
MGAVLAFPRPARAPRVRLSVSAEVVPFPAPVIAEEPALPSDVSQLLEAVGELRMSLYYRPEAMSAWISAGRQIMQAQGS